MSRPLPARVGVQLYTLRREMAQDWVKTLECVAAMGAQGIEFAGRPDASPKCVAEVLRLMGLVAPCGHVALESLEQRLDDERRWAETLGFDLLVVSWIPAPSTLEQARAIARRFALSRDRVQKAGLRLAWHNHDFEFAPLDGTSLFNELESHAPGMTWELDLGWAWFADQPLEALLDNLAHRVPVVHVKDFRTRQPGAFCPVGEGAVGYERLLPALPSRGVEWIMIEQDEIEPGQDGFASVERSLSTVRRCLA